MVRESNKNVVTQGIHQNIWLKISKFEIKENPISRNGKQQCRHRRLSREENNDQFKHLTKSFNAFPHQHLWDDNDDDYKLMIHLRRGEVEEGEPLNSLIHLKAFEFRCAETGGKGETRKSGVLASERWVAPSLFQGKKHETSKQKWFAYFYARK